MLQAAFASLAAPVEVFGELVRGEDLGLLPAVDWTWLPQIQLSAAEAARAQDFLKQLGVGESACLAAAEARGGFVLTDDLAARHVAATVGMEVTGTLGVLKRLIQAETLSLAQANELLAEMIARGYRSPIRSLREI